MTHCPSCNVTLPDPPERFCPNCGADLQTAGQWGTTPDGGAAGWVPPPPMPEGASAHGWTPPSLPRGSGGTPWERRAELGFVAALIDTTQAVLMRPAQFFREMPRDGGIGAPLAYGVILGYLGLVAKSIYDLVFSTVFGTAMADMASNPQYGPLVNLLGGNQGVLGFVLSLLFGPLGIVIGIFIGAGIVHLVLMMLGGAKSGFEATLRVVCYSEAGALWNLFPVCGALFSIVHMTVLWVIGIAEAHGISRGKAAAAVLLPLVFFCCCCVGAAALMVGGLASLIGSNR